MVNPSNVTLPYHHNGTGISAPRPQAPLLCASRSGELKKKNGEDTVKTPLISTYIFSGLATVQVLIFGGRTYFRGGGGGV